MFHFSKIRIEDIDSLVVFVKTHRNDVPYVIKELGEIKEDNGYGTIFLEPRYTIFKTFWVYVNDGKIDSLGFGGENLGLMLSAIFSKWPSFKQVYNRYDDVFDYLFYSDDRTIQISSQQELFTNGKLSKDIEVNSIQISIRD